MTGSDRLTMPRGNSIAAQPAQTYKIFRLWSKSAYIRVTKMPIHNERTNVRLKGDEHTRNYCVNSDRDQEAIN